MKTCCVARCSSNIARFANYTVINFEKKIRNAQDEKETSNGEKKKYAKQSQGRTTATTPTNPPRANFVRNIYAKICRWKVHNEGNRNEN